MTKNEREKLEVLIARLYLALRLAQEQYPDNQILIDRILNDINLARELLKM